MKILQINDDYQRLGGAETYYFNLIDLLRKNGHKVSIFAIRGRPKETKDTLVAGKAKGLLPHYFSRYVFNFKVYFKLKRFITKTKPDIIHIHNNYLAPFSVLLAVCGYKVVQTVHDYMIICPCGWMVNRKNLEPCHGKGGCFVNGCLSWYNSLISYIPFQIRKIVTKKVVKTFVSPSKLMKKYLESFGFLNVHHLPYFLNVKKYPFKSKHSQSRNILYIGRLVREKGIENLIKSMPSIASEIKNVYLTIVGEGPQKNHLISLVKQLEVVGRTKYEGKVTHAQVKKFYQNADVVVVPSLWFDNSPNVVYEAFSSGRPVIASDRGGMSDFVKNGETGFVYKSGDVRELSGKIIQILNDDELQQKLSVNCRKFALANFTSEKHYQRIIEIYDEN